MNEIEIKDHAIRGRDRDIEMLKAQVAQLTKERDEARAMMKATYESAKLVEAERDRALVQLADLAREYEGLRGALKDSKCRCECATHGYECGSRYPTCRRGKECKRCEALAVPTPATVAQRRAEEELNHD